MSSDSSNDPFHGGDTVFNPDRQRNLAGDANTDNPHASNPPLSEFGGQTRFWSDGQGKLADPNEVEFAAAESQLPDASTTSSDLLAAADHLDDVEFEFVDLTRHYEIQGTLGQGGMGIVFRAIEKAMRRPVAIKRLQPELVNNRRALARFQSEAITVAALNHENIVRIYRMGRDAIGPFLVLEMVEGGSLAQRLEQGTPELPEAIRMFIGLASGLSLSHQRGIIHRDIKPGNILLTADGVAKLSDFGIARQEDGIASTTTNSVLGTPAYMSPEQLRSATAVTELSDLYSLAATFYHTVTGELPLSIRERRLPEPVREVTMRALESDPKQRHASVDEFAAELRAVQLRIGDTTKSQGFAAGLRDGECSSCHTINALSANFCRKCSHALTEPCPKCSASTSVWNECCSACSTNISAYWIASERDLEQQGQQIELLSSEHRFGKALDMVLQIQSLTSPRWKRWKDWATETAVTIRSGLSEQMQTRDRLLADAQQAFQSAQYSRVTALLDQIHPDQVTSEIASLRERSMTRLSELEQLLQQIKSQVASKDFDGLRTNVTRVLAISPGDSRVTKLNEQIRQRDQAILLKKRQREAEELEQVANRKRQQQLQEEEAARLAKANLQAKIESEIFDGQDQLDSDAQDGWEKTDRSENHQSHSRSPTDRGSDKDNHAFNSLLDDIASTHIKVAHLNFIFVAPVIMSLAIGIATYNYHDGQYDQQFERQSAQTRQLFGETASHGDSEALTRRDETFDRLEKGRNRAYSLTLVFGAFATILSGAALCGLTAVWINGKRKQADIELRNLAEQLRASHRSQFDSLGGTNAIASQQTFFAAILAQSAAMQIEERTLTMAKQMISNHPSRSEQSVTATLSRSDNNNPTLYSKLGENVQLLGGCLASLWVVVGTPACLTMAFWNSWYLVAFLVISTIMGIAAYVANIRVDDH